MAKFTGSFQVIQFGCQALFLVVVAGITFVLRPTTVVVAQISQGLNTSSTLVLFGIGWFCYLEPVDAVRKLPEGHNMLLEGFKNNFKTMKSINTHFKKGIRWFFLALTFSQAGRLLTTWQDSIVWQFLWIDFLPITHQSSYFFCRECDSFYSCTGSHFRIGSLFD